MLTEQDLVKKCMAAICHHYGFDPLSNLSQRDLEFISDEIREKTDILISPSTLKRLQRGEFTRLPQVATLNAIAACLGHRNWQEFKKTSGNTGPVIPARPHKIRFGKMRASRKMLFLACPVVIIIILGFLYKPGGSPRHYDKAVFSAKKLTGNDIPNTVVFTYDIDQVNADSFFIQQSWDRRRRVRIYKKTHVLTDIYYEPGYHIAKLFAGDSVIRTIDVSIPTDKWIVYASSFQGDKLPQYIRKGDLFTQGHFSLDDSMLDQSHVSTDENSIFVSAYFPSMIRVNSDSLIYKTRIRLKETRSARCPYIMFEVFCKRRFMYFRSFEKGCASEADANFGDHALSGKTTDLSPVCYPLSEWTDVELHVMGKKVSIFLNGENKFTTNYSTSCGAVAGLGIISNGLYEVSTVSLKGVDGTTVYESGNALEAPLKQSMQ